MVEWLLIIALLIFAGLVLLALEMMTPMFGLFMAMGVGAFIAAVTLTFIKVSPVLGVILIIAIVILVPLYMYLVARKLPNAPLSKKLFLSRRPEAQPGEGTPEAAEHAELVGKTGLAETTLRPSGAVRIEGRRVIASAESGLIEQGTTVKVIDASGMNVVVRAVEKKD
ncbi:MAG: hypothetical protein GWP05_10850 [Anaerolineaceae bacterium]|nr:hypothetical protein [Anaerolineaceae bacterium]